MSKLYPKLLFLTLFLLIDLKAYASASDAKINGIWYSLDVSTLKAAVCAWKFPLGADKELYKYSGDIEIPQYVKYLNNTFTVTDNERGAFLDCGSLTSVTIPNSVVTIGHGAFSGCSILTSVSIGNGTKNIGGYAFDNCPNLKDVYCYANRGLETMTSAFYKVPLESATLHVLPSAFNWYRKTEPWSNFGTITHATEDECLDQLGKMGYVGVYLRDYLKDDTQSVKIQEITKLIEKYMK